MPLVSNSFFFCPIAPQDTNGIQTKKSKNRPGWGWKQGQRDLGHWQHCVLPTHSLKCPRISVSCRYSQEAWRSAGSNNNKLLGAEGVKSKFWGPAVCKVKHGSCDIHDRSHDIIYLCWNTLIMPNNVVVDFICNNNLSGHISTFFYHSINGIKYLKSCESNFLDNCDLRVKTIPPH